MIALQAVKKCFCDLIVMELETPFNILFSFFPTLKIRVSTKALVSKPLTLRFVFLE